MQDHLEIANHRGNTSWALLTALALSALLPSMSASSTNVALPALSRSFGASFAEVQWIVLANLLATTTLVVSAGRLGDAVGRRRMLAGGIVLFSVASIACAMANTLGLLVAARALQGIGSAAMMAMSMTLATEAAPPGKAGRVLGTLGTMSAGGTALGPSLGGILIHEFGWQAIYVVNVPVAIAALLLMGKWTSPETRSHQAHKFDVEGTLVLTATLAAYGLSMTFGANSFGVITLVLWTVTIVGFAEFWRTQSVSNSPLIQVSLLRNATISSAFAMNALVSAIVMATLVVGPFYLAHGLQLDGASIGLVMAVGPLVAAFTGAPAGRLVDSTGAWPVTVIGIVSLIAGTVTLSVASPWLDATGYAGALALMTGGYACFQAANNTTAMTSAPGAERGVVSGLVNLSRNLGLLTGTAAMGSIFSQASGLAKGIALDTIAVTQGMQATFGAAAILGLVVLILAVKFRPHADQT